MERTVYRPQDGAGYARAVVIDHPTHQQIAMAGVIPTDDAGNIVGSDDMYAQTQQVYANIADHLAEFGGELADIIRHRVFVTTMSDEAINGFHDAHTELFDSPEDFPAGTLVEIESLVLGEAMIEIEVDAVIPHDGWEHTVEQ